MRLTYYIEKHSQMCLINTLLFAKNLCHLCVIERHGKTGEFAHGFLKNFNLKSGAIASSVGHDAHNIIVAGLNLEDMQLAIDTIQKDQGGVVIILAIAIHSYMSLKKNTN